MLGKKFKNSAGSAFLPQKSNNRSGARALSVSKAVRKASDMSALAVYDSFQKSGSALAWTHGALTGRNRLKAAFNELDGGSSYRFRARYGAVRVFPSTLITMSGAVSEAINLEGAFMQPGAGAAIAAGSCLAYLQIHSFYHTGKLLKQRPKYSR
jgi:hypothetical protein